MDKIEKIRAEIERRRKEFIEKGEQTSHDAEIIRRAVISDCNDLLSFIDSLQQEQPKVDLEREIRDYFSKWDYDPYDGVITMNNDIVATLSSVLNVARHFYELGFNARKEEKIC